MEEEAIHTFIHRVEIVQLREYYQHQLLEEIKVRFSNFPLHVSRCLFSQTHLGEARFPSAPRSTPAVLLLLWFQYQVHDCRMSLPFSCFACLCSTTIVQGFATLHNHYRWTTGFQAHFIAWAVVNLSRCFYISREKAMTPATFLLKRAFLGTFLGTICWMVSFDGNSNIYVVFRVVLILEQIER